MRVVLIFAALMMSGEAQAGYVERHPAIGDKLTVSAGGEAISSKAVATVKGSRLEEDSDWGGGYPAGTNLVSVATKAKHKGCVASESTLAPMGPCFLDDDGDGVFDRISSDNIYGASKAKTPVRYSLIDIPYPDQSSLRRVILYQGADSSTLKLNYREFSGTLARPAFNEELSVPLAKDFPQKVAVKGVIFTIFKIDGMGLTYQIDSADGF